MMKIEFSGTQSPFDPQASSDPQAHFGARKNRFWPLEDPQNQKKTARPSASPVPNPIDHHYLEERAQKIYNKNNSA